MLTKDISKFKEIDHTADIGISACGDSIPELLANLCFGMMHLIAGNIDGGDKVRYSINIEESSLSDLIVSWLSEINYLISVHHFLLSAIEEITIKENDDIFQLSAMLIGGDNRNVESELMIEIKAVTYHQLKCEKKGEEYIAQVIFDI